jgi:hypothetical protein
MAFESPFDWLVNKLNPEKTPQRNSGKVGILVLLLVSLRDGCSVKEDENLFVLGLRFLSKKGFDFDGDGTSPRIFDSIPRLS